MENAQVKSMLAYCLATAYETSAILIQYQD